METVQFIDELKNDLIRLSQKFRKQKSTAVR